MSKYTHTKVPQFFIYAIVGVDDGGTDVAYIDKTTSSDLARILCNHRKGRNYVTAEDFREGGCSPNPSIHVLEVLRDISPAGAYRHVLAWMHYFSDNGFVLLSHEKMERMADNLSPHTETILQEISKRSIPEILANPPKLDNEETDHKEDTTAQKSELTQLNVRVSRDEKTLFSEFCTQKGLSQREGLVYLLANENSEASATLISEQREIILNQSKRIQACWQTIAKGSRGANADKRLKSMLAFQQKAINEYFSRLLPSERKEPMLKCTSWNRHHASFPNYGQYAYPKTDGVAVLKLEAICYGQGSHPAIFIWGTTLEESTPRKIRLRSYAKKEYFGISIGGNPQSYKGAPFFVGYRISNDGAADLYAAYPMDISAHSERTSEPAKRKHPSLEERIRNARHLL